MILQMLRWFLGPLFVILEYFKNRPELLGLVFALYLVILGIGKWHLKKIKTRMDLLILQHGSTWVKENRELTSEQFMERFTPIWEKELNSFRFPFIMNKHDLWPVSVTPDHVQVKLPLTGEYVKDVLAASGIVIRASTRSNSKKKAKK